MKMSCLKQHLWDLCKRNNSVGEKRSNFVKLIFFKFIVNEKNKCSIYVLFFSKRQQCWPNPISFTLRNLTRCVRGDSQKFQEFEINMKRLLENRKQSHGPRSYCRRMSAAWERPTLRRKLQLFSIHSPFPNTNLETLTQF
ncbi:Uncharacterised protein at_DN0641 [Pycnogonum litorale]